MRRLSSLLLILCNLAGWSTAYVHSRRELDWHRIALKAVATAELCAEQKGTPTVKEPTKIKLAHALRSAGFEQLANRAELGEFSDFEGPHALPKVELVGELGKIYKNPSIAADICQKAHVIALQVMRGEFDETKEEAEAWAKSQGLESPEPVGKKQRLVRTP